MSATAPHPVGEVLGYQDRLPFAWLPASAVRSRADLMDEAQRVLVACAMLEETRRRSDESSPLEADVDRLHLKMDLVLEMLGNLLSAQLARPAPQPLWLSSQGVLWLEHGPCPAAGSQGLVSIHLHAALPRPLLLPAVILHAGGGETSARFDGLNEACQSELERHVFLRHRRAIAINHRSSPGR